MDNIICNHCGSEHYSSFKRGYSIATGLISALALGFIMAVTAGGATTLFFAFVGLALGFSDAKKIIFICLACGNRIDVRQSINTQRRAAGQKPLPMSDNTKAWITFAGLMVLFYVLMEYFPVNG